MICKNKLITYVLRNKIDKLVTKAKIVFKKYDQQLGNICPKLYQDIDLPNLEMISPMFDTDKLN